MLALFEKKGNIHFTSKHAGLLYIKAISGSQQKTYSIRDVYIGGDFDTISTTWLKNTSVSGRTIYSHSPDLTEDIEMEFKFKDSIPKNFVVGFALVNAPFTAKGTFNYWTNTTSNNGLCIYYSGTGWNETNKEVKLGEQFQSITKDTVFKIKTVNLHRIEWYIDDVIAGYRDTETSVPLQIRYDYFDNDSELEYLIIRKL